jgi:hypothetical protein
MGDIKLSNHSIDTLAITAEFESPEDAASGVIRLGLQPGEDGRYRTDIEVREPAPGTTTFVNQSETDNAGMIQDERRLAMTVAYSVRRAKELAELRQSREM